MLRFKVFSGSPEPLEAEINGWLAQFEPDVTQMVQTMDGGGALTISFLFEESFRGQELRYTSERSRPHTASPAAPGASMPDEPLTVPIEPGSTPT